MKIVLGIKCSLFALLIAVAMPGHADVVFNWTQILPPGADPRLPGNEYRAMSVNVAEEVYLAAQIAPVTFGVTSASSSDGPSGSPITIGPTSSDVTALVIVRGFTNTQVLSAVDGMAFCANAPFGSVNCRASFSSTAVTLGGALNGGFIQWRENNERFISTTFSLFRDSLSTQIRSGPFQSFELSTNSQGVGSWGAGADGSAGNGGQGLWLVDLATIPRSSAVPLPGTLALCLVGAVYLRGCRMIRRDAPRKPALHEMAKAIYPNFSASTSIPSFV